MKKKTTMPLMYLSILAALTGARFAQVHSLIAIPLLILAVSLLVAFYASTLNQFKELSEKEQKEEREIFTHKNHD